MFKIQDSYTDPMSLQARRARRLVIASKRGNLIAKYITPIGRYVVSLFGDKMFSSAPQKKSFHITIGLYLLQ